MNKLWIGFILVMLSFSSFSGSLKVGDIAPDFRLQATTGEFFQLSDYKGKQAVVLAWYPMANTRGCTLECLSLTQKGHLIKQFDVSYFMASVDPLDDNRDFAEKTNANFPMLSDPDKSIAKAYKVLNLFRVASRVTFYIDKYGIIKKIDDDINTKSAAEDIAHNLKVLNFDIAKK